MTVERRKYGTGSVYSFRGKFYARMPVGGRRLVAAIPWCSSEEAAEARVDVLAEMLVALRASPEGLEVAPRLLEKAAGTDDPIVVERCRELARRFAAGEVTTKPGSHTSKDSSRAPKKPAPPGTTGPTFREVARLWTRGELAKLHPDHVRTKRTSVDDEQRLEQHVYPHVGHVAIAAFTLADADRAMSAMSSKLAPATRRQVAQTIARVLKLAVYPLRLLGSSPIPPGWLPRVPKGSQKKQEVLYPPEHDTFLGCEAVPLVVRLLAGFIAREGMRHEEAEGLTWGDVDLEAGLVRLDENKTDDARSWAMTPGTARALARWRVLRGEPDAGELVFVDEHGRPLRLRGDVYREHLEVAGVTRAELHEGGPRSKPTAIHGLRALFVTEALARGMSESWVTDRTGHQSSAMVAVYKRRARTFREARLAELKPLDVALGWARSDSASATTPDGQQDTAPRVQQDTPSRRVLKRSLKREIAARRAHSRRARPIQNPLS